MVLACALVIAAWYLRPVASTHPQALPAPLVDGFVGFQTLREVDALLAQKDHGARQERAYSATRGDVQFETCAAMLSTPQRPSERPRHDTCFLTIDDYAYGQHRTRLNLFLYNDRLTEVRFYPERVPAFHTAISEQFNVTLFAENRIKLNEQVEIGTHLDSGGHVSYFWQQRALSQEFDDWLKRHGSP